MLSDDDFRRLLKFLDRPWAGYRKIRKGVQKRIRRHMSQSDCQTIDQYLDLITHQPDIRAACEARLLVTISRFFRDRQLWDHLTTRFFPDLMNQYPEPIRIWSAGCASGEEPYSIAMAWMGLSTPLPLQLLATDANTQCLERARRGLYDRSSLKEVSEALKNRFFLSRRGGRRYMVRQVRLPTISWRSHHLLDPPPPGPFHAVFLRNNLLTYYQGAALEKSFFDIARTLAPDGLLVIGSHEHLPDVSMRLQRDEKCPWIYRNTRVKT